MKNTKKITLCASAIMLLAALPAFAATNDYVNYWSFDDAGGRSVADAAGGQNGVLTGTSTGFGWAGGKVGTALSMDGLTGESVVLLNGFLKGSQGSISVWFKLDALSYGNIIFSGKSTTDNNIYVAFLVDHDGRPVLQFRDTTSGNDRKVQGAKLLNKNEWYNVVLTANGLTYRVYVNGEEINVAGDNTGRWLPDLTNQTFQYRIGSLDATPMNGVFTGILDELKIYNRALSFDEVTTLYNEGNAGGPTVPLAIRPALSFTISSDHIPFGGSVTVNWTGINVTSCVASGSWSGAVATSGTQVFSYLGGDATYNLSCSGQGGSTQSSVRVVVSPKDATTTPTVSAPGLTVVALSSQGDILPSTSEVTQVVKTVPPTLSTRHAVIQELINQILLLIGELQKQLAVLKAQGAH